jgi:hypothetical protein
MALIKRAGLLVLGLAVVLRLRRRQSDSMPEPGPTAPAPPAPPSSAEIAPETPATESPAPEPPATESPAPEPPDDDVLVAQEEAAAGAAAARIGGVVTPEVDDPALEPVYEAGGGEAEGWEAAEAELVENASHGEGHANPERDAFAPERESDRAGAVYGEADEVVSTESVEDDRSAPEDDRSAPEDDAR